MIKNYLVGGKLGDFIHGLVVCKRMYEKNGEKANVFIDNIGDPFERSLEFTYNELKPILEKQKWLNEFKIYSGEHVDVNINEFRNSEYLYKTNWLNIYFKTFIGRDEEPPKEYQWIEMSKNPEFTNTLLVNRSSTRVGLMDENVIQRYLNLITRFERRYFICFDKSQYENFQLKSYFDLIIVSNLYEYFEIINSCKLFIGNQSGPYAWASAMNTPRILEIFKTGNQITIDGIHYLTDDQYYQNFGII